MITSQMTFKKKRKKWISDEKKKIDGRDKNPNILKLFFRELRRRKIK